MGILLLLVGFLGWRTLSGKEEESQVRTAAVERGTIVSSVSASGEVLSVNIMSANTKASGVVKEVFVEDGDQVKAGDKILEIDLDFQGQQKHAQSYASYLSAKSSLEATKQGKLTALKGLEDAKSKLITAQQAAEGTDGWDPSDPNKQKIDSDRRSAELSFQAAQQEYANYDQKIKKSEVDLTSAWLSYQQTAPTITAPTDGTITSLMFTEGMSIGSLDTGSTTSNQKVATIQKEGMPVISVNLSEIDVSRVELGQKATITLDSIADKTFTGEVTGVDRIGAVSSGVVQYPAIIELNSSSPQILPNMVVTANILIDKKDNVLLVPSSAVQTQDDQSFVSVLKDGQQQAVLVETGLVSDTQTEIVSGLEEGDLVVTGTVSSASSQQNGTSPFGGGMGEMMRMAR